MKLDWKALVDRLSPYMNNDQKDEAKAAVDRRQKQLEDFLADFEDDIRTYRHEEYRLEQLRSAPGALDVPNQRARVISRAANPTGERGVAMLIESSPGVWQSGARGIEQDLKNDLSQLLDPKDPGRPVGGGRTSLVDQRDAKGRVLFRQVWRAGRRRLLIVGLFTGLASWAGAVYAVGRDDATPVAPGNHPYLLYGRGDGGAAGAGGHGRGPLVRSRLLPLSDVRRRATRRLWRLTPWEIPYNKVHDPGASFVPSHRHSVSINSLGLRCIT